MQSLRITVECEHWIVRVTNSGGQVTRLLQFLGTVTKAQLMSAGGLFVGGAKCCIWVVPQDYKIPPQTGGGLTLYTRELEDDGRSVEDNERVTLEGEVWMPTLELDRLVADGCFNSIAECSLIFEVRGLTHFNEIHEVTQSEDDRLEVLAFEIHFIGRVRK